MSDALTDISRDERRGNFYEMYLEALKEFLQCSTDDNKKEVIKMAEKTDSVKGGYWGSSTSYCTKDTEAVISKLQEGDKNTWVKLLFSLKNRHDFGSFKLLSPFADKFLIAVDYGCGFVDFSGEIGSFIASIIRDGKGWATYDADDYIVVLDKPSTDNAEVFWVKCGTWGVKGPRVIKK